MSSKLVIPVTLGVSLITVSAFVVYYLFLKEEEPDKKPKSQIKSSRVNVIEVQVPKPLIPAVIGRGGSNIKEIQKKAGVDMFFKKRSENDYDVCVIRGASEATQLAENMLHEFMNNQPVIVDETIDVPTWSCGKIIGSGGENILEMSHRSGAKIKVDGDRTSELPTRKVFIKGSKEQIAHAKELIEKCVAQEKCRREIEESKRAPRVSLEQGTKAGRGGGDGAPQDAGDLSHLRHVKRTRRSEAGSTLEVMVSAVSSPSRFWVQLAGAQVSQLDALVQHMTDYYGNRDNRQQCQLGSVEVGQLVAAVFRQDGRWYRARVIDLRPNEFDPSRTVADCFFLDYGDNEYVNVDELCELTADLLRLKFQAMECFLAGVSPKGRAEEVVGVTESGQRWDKWPREAIERFEDLTQVAQWKSLKANICYFKKSVSSYEPDKVKDVPGIKLYDVSDGGEVDIGATLIAEGLAVAAPSPRASPARVLPSPSAPSTPFGDLGSSRVLGMLNDRTARGSSLPKDHGRISPAPSDKADDKTASNPNFFANRVEPKRTHMNGDHDAFLASERLQSEENHTSSKPLPAIVEDLKANMNRIDSHHNLDALTRNHHGESHGETH